MRPIVFVTEPWQAIGLDQPRDRLLATITVHGCLVHLEAIRVEERSDDGIRYASDAAFEDLLEAATTINGDGNFSTATLEIDGIPGDYVFLATSYAD